MSLRERSLQSRDVVALVSDKWGIDVLHLLSRGPLRTSQLQRLLETISLKVLTQTLRRMQRDGLVERRPHAVVPPRVEYQLTEMGRSLLKPLGEFCNWAEAYLEQRDLARSRYDAAEPLRLASNVKRRSGPKAKGVSARLVTRTSSDGF